MVTCAISVENEKNTTKKKFLLDTLMKSLTRPGKTVLLKNLQRKEHDQKVSMVTCVRMGNGCNDVTMVTQV